MYGKSKFEFHFLCRRFANIPDIIELDHLTVSGDVTFGRGVSLRVSKLCCFVVVVVVQ